MTNAIGSRRTRGHPPWCHEERCLVPHNKLGEHRSEPLLAVGAIPGARIVATRVQAPAGTHWLELTLNVPLLGPVETDRARTAQLVLDGLVYTLDAALRRVASR